jgi:putative Ca2+/H+ antiporter (TMEM165/GDT1 family)
MILQSDRVSLEQGKLRMNLWPILVTVFFAELGDKTQLATLLFAASARALVLSSFIAVLVGSQLSAYLPHRALKLAAGVGFIAIVIWNLIDSRT